MADSNSPATPSDDELKERWADAWILYERGAWQLAEEDRKRLLHGVSVPLEKTKDGELGVQNPIPLFEEVIAVIFLFVCLGSMFWIPIAGALMVLFVRSPVTYAVIGTVFLLLSFHPISRSEAFLHSR